MATLKKTLWMTFILLITASCSVVSQRIRDEAMPAIPFKTLLQEIDKHVGEMVVLGGYILETENRVDETIIKVLQAPLTIRDEPKDRDFSEGRFIVIHKGFLDPEVYSKDRKITVAGIIVGCKSEKIETCPLKFIKIESREIYLWQKYEYLYPPLSPYPYYDDWFYPFPYRRYPHDYHRYYW
ncbi:MAG: Slp family lipoprotein [Desulfobacterales bacterium]|nr:Slp family lipoprotein [Desulfobacterales bacterium]